MPQAADFWKWRESKIANFEDLATSKRTNFWIVFYYVELDCSLGSTKIVFLGPWTEMCNMKENYSQSLIRHERQGPENTYFQFIIVQKSNIFHTILQFRLTNYKSKSM